MVSTGGLREIPPRTLRCGGLTARPEIHQSLARSEMRPTRTAHVEHTSPRQLFGTSAFPTATTPTLVNASVRCLGRSEPVFLVEPVNDIKRNQGHRRDSNSWV